MLLNNHTFMIWLNNRSVFLSLVLYWGAVNFTIKSCVYPSLLLLSTILRFVCWILNCFITLLFVVNYLNEFSSILNYCISIIIITIYQLQSKIDYFNITFSSTIIKYLKTHFTFYLKFKSAFLSFLILSKTVECY